MKHITVGTAGHIDHGKTALVKALTGIDTDRLKEEKERGITIDLGFAHLELPNGMTVGIVDVPGHERFIKNMLAGVGGIDLVMLIVAADEGVMPQTREHLAICQLLRIKDGLAVLTKRDLVDAEWLELVGEDVAGTLKGTFLEGKPIRAVSSKTGEGLDELKATLAHLAEAVPPRPTDATFRLPIDRVFTIKGFGTVVTGTLLAGKVAVEDRVEVYPKGLQAKVRSLQSHGRSVTEAKAGQRTAVNLQGLEKAAIERGDVLSLPDCLEPTYMLDAQLQLTAAAPRPLKNRDRVRFHVGTSEVMARVILLDREELAPGQHGYVQFRLEAPVVALPEDRYVIRSYSPIITIGGGGLLDVAPRKAKRRSVGLLARLERLEHGTPAQVLEEHLRTAEAAGARLARLRTRTPFSPGQLRHLMADLVASGIAVPLDKEGSWFLHQEAYAGLRKAVLSLLEGFHAQNPLKAGIPKEELRARLNLSEDRVFLHLLEELERGGNLVVDRDKVRLAAHQVRLGPLQQALLDRLEDEFRSAGVQPPSQEETFAKLGVEREEDRELFQLLLDERKLVRVKESLYFHATALKTAEEELVAYLRKNGEITPGDVKDLLGVTRKYAIPLMEYFDTLRVTMRVGDKRMLARRTS